MPDATITSTASTFGTITGTFAADQSTVTGTVSSLITGTLSGSVGVPGPQGPAGPQGPEGPPGPPGPGSTWGTITGTLSAQTDLQTALNLKANLASPVFTGDPQAPTATFGDNDTTIATTAFVQAGLLGGTANARNLEVYVRNQSGSTIPAGAIVYISGATGNRPLITLAQANNDANSAQTIGFVKTSIANNGFGYVIVRGELENVDTSALTEGVQLYLSPTTAGAWTTTKPSAPEHLVYVGIVVRSHPTQGVILVAVQNGYELNELHDVAISSPTNGQVLKYDSATNLWKNSTDSAGVAWGGITGTLSNQTDLQSALDAKQSVSGMTAYLTKAGNLSGLTNLATARDNLQLGTSNDVYFSSVISNTGTVTSILGGATNGLEIFDGVTNGIKIDKDGITFPDLTVQTSAFTTAQLGAYLAKASNLSDLTSASTARTNLGLGSLAVVNDAPSNGNQYARKNGAWDVVSVPASYITSVSSPLSVAAGNLSIDLSAYLTTSAAASTYQTIAGMSSYLTTSAAASTYYPLTNPAGYITSSALTPYLTSATAASTYQTISGMSSYLTTSAASSTYRALSNNTFGNIGITAGNAMTIDDGGSPIGETVLQNAGLLIRDTSNVPLARFQYDQVLLPSAGLTFADATTQTTAGLSPATAASTYQTIAGMSSYLTTSAAASTYQTIAGMSSYLTTAAAASTYAPLAGATFTGLISTLAPTTATAGLRLPHGTAPTSPVNGDLFTTTSGLFARINGATRQYVDFDGTQTINGNKTFSNATLVFGNSTAASTTSIASGATLTATTKTVNIGTSGVSGSTTNVNIGSAVAGALGTITASQLLVTKASAAAGAGFRLSPGAAPSTPTNGDLWATTTDVQVRLNGVTETLAEQSWVTAQGYITSSALSPYLLSSTAASTYAPLASPALTGTPTAPTATAGTNTTQIATTAFVQAAVSGGSGAVWGSITGTLSSQTDLQTALNAKLDSTTAASTYQTIAGMSSYLTTASAASTYAPLASPALTGTPTSTTAAAGTSTTQIATTAFVTTADNLKANLASPTFTGTPAAPTAAAGTNTTQIATTAFVQAAIPTNNVKAWVNFNGTGTVAIKASSNVTSITDNGVGDYTINFTTALADANYAVTTSSSGGFGVLTGLHSGWITGNSTPTTKTTSAARIVVTYYNNGFYDVADIGVAIIR